MAGRVPNLRESLEMAVLHPLECYLLESFSSPEHFAVTRDAIIEWVDVHEAALARLQAILDPHERSKPHWQQGDIVWGHRLLPEIRLKRCDYINAYIQRVNNDPTAFNAVGTINFDDRCFSEFRNGWMLEEERQCISVRRERASILDKRLAKTSNGNWNEGDFTYNGQDRIYRLNELPQRIPRYELDPSVRIKSDGRPKQMGVYLPDVSFAAAQWLYPTERFRGGKQVRRRLRRRTWFATDADKRDFDWREDELVETGWTLVRRVEGEFIDVPEQGFFPKGEPNELYTWPEREAQFIVTGAHRQESEPLTK